MKGRNYKSVFHRKNNKITFLPPIHDDSKQTRTKRLKDKFKKIYMKST